MSGDRKGEKEMGKDGEGERERREDGKQNLTTKKGEGGGGSESARTLARGTAFQRQVAATRWAGVH